MVRSVIRFRRFKVGQVSSRSSFANDSRSDFAANDFERMFNYNNNTFISVLNIFFYRVSNSRRRVKMLCLFIYVDR